MRVLINPAPVFRRPQTLDYLLPRLPKNEVPLYRREFVSQFTVVFEGPRRRGVECLVSVFRSTDGATEFERL